MNSEDEKSNDITQDCQPCRYVGTGLFLFVAAYIWYNTRNTVSNDTLYKKLPLRLVAIGSIYMSVARYFYFPPFKHLAPKKIL